MAKVVDFNSLLENLQGSVIAVKDLFFKENEQCAGLDDNDAPVHRLCVNLEKLLRVGAKEKYTFTGTKKDYWNFIHDCLPKEEMVRFIASIPGNIFSLFCKDDLKAPMEFRTNQGKGRALIRQALMEKSLADTLQRCAITEKIVRDYYDLSSVFRNAKLQQQLVDVLYDLNSVTFNLPYKGYDFDRSWPALSRKALHGRKRTNSTSSLASIASSIADEESLDSIHTLSRNVKRLETLLKSWDVDFVETPCKSDCSVLENSNESLVNLHGGVVKLKVLTDQKIQASTNEIKTLQERHDHSLENRTKEFAEKQEKHDKDFQEMQLKNNRLEEQCLELQKQVEELNSSKHILEKEIASGKCVTSSLEQECQQSRNELEMQGKEMALKDNELLLLRKSNENEGKIDHFIGEMRGQLLQIEPREIDEDIKKRCAEIENEHESKIDKLRQEYGTKLNDLEIALRDTKSNLKSESTAKKTIQKCFDEEREIFAAEKNKLEATVNELNILVEDSKSKEKEMAVKAFADLASLNQELLDNRQDLESLQQKLDECEKTSNCSLDAKILAERTLEEKTQLLKREVEKYELLEQSSSELTAELERHRCEAKELSDECERMRVQEVAVVNFLQGMLGTDAEDGKKTAVDCSVKLAERLSEELEKTRAFLEQSEQECIGLKYELTSTTKNFKQLQSDSRNEIQRLKDEHTSTLNDLKEANLQLQAQVTEKETILESFKTKGGEKESELLNKIDALENETKTLNFQLNTQQIKNKQFIKEIEILKASYETLDQTSTADIEKLKSDSSIEVAAEKQRNKMLLEKIEELGKEVCKLKDEKEKATKGKEEELRKNEHSLNRLNNLKQEKVDSEKRYEEEIEQLKGDMEDMKQHLVSLARDKQDLWEQKDSLEFTLKCRDEDRWVKDKEVEACSDCLKPFSLLMRKHHCRLCGGIFCHDCSNTWVQTHPNKKKVRSCNSCVASYKEKHVQADVVDGLSESNLSESNLSESDSVHDQSVAEQDGGMEGECGGGGEVTKIKFIEGDFVWDAVVPVVRPEGEEEEGGLSIRLTPGSRYRVPLCVSSNKFHLQWSFTSSPTDVGFGLAYKPNMNTSDEEIQTVVSLRRYESHRQTISGQIRVEKSGIFYIIFDNSYSRLMPKFVQCNVSLIPISC